MALIPLGFVGFEFIPAVDRGQIFVQVQFPTGTPLTTTDAAVRTLSSRFLDLPDVRRITSTSGTMQAGFGGGVALGSNGQISVFLKTNRSRSTDRGRAHHDRDRDTGWCPTRASSRSRRPEPRGGNAQPIDVTVTATRGEPDAYAAAGPPRRSKTRRERRTSTAPRCELSPQIDIEFNRDRARALDLDIGSAAAAVRAAFGGTLATQFDTDNGTKYVQVLYPLADQTSLNDAASRSRCARAPARIVHLGDVAILQNARRRR